MVMPAIEEYLSEKAIKQSLPLHGTFELSPCCNMNCRMCYVRKSREEVRQAGGEITKEQWLDMAKQAKAEGLLFLLFTGGEPFYYPDFRELYEEIHQMGFMISINTNGTLIDESTVKWLKRYPPFRINMTLYGGSEETYERLCHYREGFQKTLKAAAMLKEAGIQIKLNASFTPYNKEDIAAVYDIARKLRIYVQGSSYMFPPIRKNENKIGQGDRFCPEDAAKYQIVIDKNRLSKEEYQLRVQAIRQQKSRFRDAEGEELRDRSEGIWCRAGKCSFWLNWKGELTPCGLMNGPAEKPFEIGFLKAWENLVRRTGELRMASACCQCAYQEICIACGASACAETGKTNLVPGYVCEMTKKMVELMTAE